MSKNVVYKSVDLFGNEQILFIQKKAQPQTLFGDYDGFVGKFEGKKTTDDCYTPDDVYNAVVNFVHQKFDLTGVEIVRPFYPDGDFESLEYSGDCVVIDNPPFSIISKIARYYIANGIRFFLFAPHLTLFSSDLECTAVVVGGNIVYENGAEVKTSFLTNLFGDVRVLAAPALYNSLMDISEKNKVNLPKYAYPDNVLTVSMVQQFVQNGIPFEVSANSCTHCRGLDSQKSHGKAIFGSGFLLSEKAAAEKAAAEKAAAEKAAAEKAAAEKDTAIVWALSKKEMEIISQLTP